MARLATRRHFTARSSGSFCRNSGQVPQPLVEIPQSARRVSMLAGDLLVLAARLLAVRALQDLDRREQAEIDIHRLERTRMIVGRLDMPASDVVDERAMRRSRRWWGEAYIETLGGGHAPGHQAHRGAFHIAFDTSNLPGKTQARVRS